jgi:RNA polymerase sigma factor (sigma-70 family)
MKTETGKQEFLKLIEDNKAIIYKICHAYCPAKSEREDLAQEIIYQLWKSGHRFNEEYKFSTWMYRVALNVAISFYRKERTKGPETTLPGQLPDIEDEPDNAGEDNIRLLQQFINELKELDKALMLLYLEEKTYAEIADIIGITETNVATKISRIKDKLKLKFSIANK